MKLGTNQTGIAHIAVLAVVIVLAVIGFAGYRVAHKTPTKSSTPASTAPAKTPDTSTTANESGTKYLAIKEWGIKFALRADTANAYYNTTTSSSIPSMSLRSHTLDSEPDCTTGPLSIAGIFRVAKDAVNDQTGKKYSDAGDGKVVGDYYYFIQSSQYNCTDKIDKLVILQGVRNSFNTAGPSIVKAN